jgi:hypothetical protein
MVKQQIPNTKCKIVNTVWIERGIILTILYYLIKKYNLIINKIIIIENAKYRILFKLLFPKLIFEKYEKDNKKNFYFNIRKIIKKQDIIIDYINNYDDFINTSKIKLVPWFDMNDILVSYIYNSNKKMNIDKYLNFIINFNKCRRGDYYNNIYDNIMEHKIFNLYLKNNKNININNLNYIINKYIKGNYTNTVNNYVIPLQEQKIYNVSTNLINDKIDTSLLNENKELKKKIEYITALMHEEKQNYKQKIDKVIKEINETDKDKNNEKLIKKYEKLKKKYNIIINNGLLYIKNLNMDKDNTILLLTEILNNFTDNISKIQEED